MTTKTEPMTLIFSFCLCVLCDLSVLLIFGLTFQEGLSAN